MIVEVFINLCICMFCTVAVCFIVGQVSMGWCLLDKVP